ncbi:MAG: pyrroloquinoline quinone biosynthesis protein PqqB, partial [Gammaproteobacteria bacterium]|nr:pyrroloquinoline quinone biosynthesis protein PqqB [Gammaproteobacteria bacterium]
MKIRVLGSAAGGGFPQWNCNCRNCAGLRGGTLRARVRTQSSIAVRAGGDRDSPAGRQDASSWALINVSPDILAQLRANPDFQPARSPRDTAICAIVLVDGQVDHTTGLYMLRESTRPWPIWCTDAVYGDLTRGNPVIEVLSHYCRIERRRMVLDGAGFAVEGVAGVRWQALPVAGKPAPYSPNRESPVAGDNVALLVTDERSRKSLFYAPGLGEIDEAGWQAMRSAACVLVDGTFWSDDEMLRLGLSHKRARDIGHLAQSGPGGMLEWLGRLPEGTRRILIHINNTNPILDEDSPERAELGRRG